MREQPLRQRGRERGVGELRRLLARRVREPVALGRAAAEAGEEEREQAGDVGVVRHVGAGEVLAARDRAGPRAGPVLADERALLRALVGVAGREAHPVARREQEPGRRLVLAREHPGERLVRRVVARDRLEPAADAAGEARLPRAASPADRRSAASPDRSGDGVRRTSPAASAA